MDPANVIGVIGVVAQTIKLIYQYGDSVAESALSQVEHDLKSFQGSSSTSLASSNLTAPESLRVLEDTRELLAPVSQSLTEGISRANRLAKRLVWPLKRQRVYDIATHLERSKTYFILAATNDTLQATRETAESLQKLHVSLEDIHVSAEQRALESSALRWLDPYDPNPTHDAALSARMNGTSNWFLVGVLNDWLLRESQMLWLTGQPGSGKTCLMAASVEKTIRLGNYAVTYFYCSSNHSASQEPRSIVASLLSQFSLHNDEARDEVVRCYRKKQASRADRPPPLDLSALLGLLRRACTMASKPLLIFIDAINECEEEYLKVLRMLVQIVSWVSTARLVLSSTEGLGRLAQRELFHNDIGALEFEISEENVTSDINMYIESRFGGEPRLIKLRPGLQEQIKEQLRVKHHGSFRWVQCTLDDLARLATPRAIKEALNGITPTLSDIYMSILVALPEDIAEVAHSMLVCLVPSHVGWLRVHELAEAAVFAMVDDFSEDDRLIEPKAVLRQLRSLVHYDPQTSKVELAHSSVRDFLTSPQRSGRFYIDPSKARVTMTRVCIGYLIAPEFKLMCPDMESLEQRINDWPLFHYASSCWTRYVQGLNPLPDDVNILASRLIASADLPCAGNWASWYQCVYPFPYGDPIIWATRPLYMCAREGLTHLLEGILPGCDKKQLEQRGGARGSTALHIAATYGRVDAVRLLLAAGADPNERNGEGQSGIRLAVLFEHEETVQELLKGGADPELLQQPIVGGVRQYY